MKKILLILFFLNLTINFIFAYNPNTSISILNIQFAKLLDNLCYNKKIEIKQKKTFLNEINQLYKNDNLFFNLRNNTEIFFNNLKSKNNKLYFKILKQNFINFIAEFYKNYNLFFFLENDSNTILNEFKKKQPNKEKILFIINNMKNIIIKIKTLKLFNLKNYKNQLLLKYYENKITNIFPVIYDKDWKTCKKIILEIKIFNNYFILTTKNQLK